ISDIEINSLKINSIAKEMVANNLVFDYATDYYYQNSAPSLNGFSFDDSDYAQFKSYVTGKGFDFETEMEKKLKTLVKTGELSEFGTEVQATYASLLLSIEKNKLNALDNYKEGLKKDIEDEIIKRYYYREGLYEHYLTSDQAIETSAKLLADSKKYQGLLR